MPSAPKKNKRRDADFYETPEWCTRAMLDYLEISPTARIIEPCAGHGAISRVIKEYFPQCTLVQYELRPNKKLQQHGRVTFGNFLKKVRFDATADFVITNPPFTYSQEFITTCRENYPNAEIIKLLPFSFLGSAKRHEWWKKNTPNMFSVLSDRPSFTNDGHTDSSVYAWYHWFNMHNKHKYRPTVFLERGDK